jgi:hypothetical protein
MEVYEGWVEYFRDEITDVYVRLKTVDDKNLFDKDDDVGFVFTEMLRIVDELDKKLKYEESQKEEQNK